MIFDGRKFAEGVIASLPKKKAKLAIFLSEDNLAGAKYVEMKMKVGKQLGVEFEIINSKFEEPNKIKILNLNKNPEITGIMIQLPFPNSQELINLIDPAKDVDGLREDSPFLPASVLAVQKILEVYGSGFMVHRKAVVVGAKGFVGRKVVKLLRTMNYEQLTEMDKEDFDPEKLKTADVIISATGSPGLIRDVKEGAICIDLGFPKGDFDPKVAERASFFTPVPGGVGPVTVACLFVNLIGNARREDFYC